MIINMSSGGSVGKIVTVHVFYRSSVNVTCTNGKKTYTGITDTNYNVIFKLPKGIWTITAEQDGYTSSINVNISEDCTIDMSIFAATIHITYPAGSICTATDGTITLTAPDTSGTWDCVVPNAGTWTVSLNSGYAESVVITGNGEEQTIDKWHLYNLGDQCDSVTGGLISEKIGSYGQVSPTFGNDDITIKYSRSYGTNHKGCAVRPKNKIDLTGISALTVHVTAKTGGSNYSRLGVSKTAPSAASSLGRYPENYIVINGTGLITLDVSALSGKYYVFFVSCSTWGKDADMSQKIVIDEMYVR